MKKNIFETLSVLVRNLWWSWDGRLSRLLADMDIQLWETSHHNPIVYLRKIGQKKMMQLFKDNPAWEKESETICSDFKSYMADTSSEYPVGPIAYFSAEYGIHESVPIYSGGLGILSGDHFKSASDINMNLTGVGLFYREGYFEQSINKEGNQVADYFPNKPEDFPVEQVCHKSGKPLVLEFPFPKGTCYVQVWQLNVGRVKIFLLDTDMKKNIPEYRKICSRLYDEGERRWIRLAQEIILGMGGVKIFKALGISPMAWHINEGHASLLLLQHSADMMKVEGGTIEENLLKNKSKVLFTTHTPVKEGLEVFKKDVIHDFLAPFLKNTGLDIQSFLNLSRFKPEADPESFNMTIFSIKYSQFANGVSKLNMIVSKKMWNNRPIGYVTNGIHHPTWIAPELDSLFTSVAWDWKQKAYKPGLPRKLSNIDGRTLWDVHFALKERLLKLVKENVASYYSRNKVSPAIISRMLDGLSPEKLTLGFARRFATYKRATLLFHDEATLDKLLLDEQRPVQIIFAGKAHPKDTDGQALVRKIYEYSLKPKYLGKIILLEGYNIDIAKYLVQGVDVWVNNPVRPYEASGTSGQKAAINGVLNCSIMDGWWPEGFNGKNGWAVPGANVRLSVDVRDGKDNRSLFDILLRKVVPLYFSQEEGFPKGWVGMMKNSILSLLPVYNTHRMIDEYYRKYYSKLGK